MLNVDVKFIANELTPGLVNGQYSIGEGSTVLELLSVCETQNGVAIPEKNLKYVYPLFNGKPVQLATPLTEDGTLHLCRVVVGG